MSVLNHVITICFISMSLDSDPSLPRLMERVAVVIPNKYEMVGLQLGLTIAELQLQVIGPHHPTLEKYQRVFGEIFDAWRRCGTPFYTWRTFIGVLMSASVGKVMLSDQLASRITLSSPCHHLYHQAMNSGPSLVL